MAAVGDFELHSFDMDQYLCRSGSELSGSTSSSFGVATGDLNSDQLDPPFDILEYFLLDKAMNDQMNYTEQVPMVQEAISSPLMDNSRVNGIERKTTERIAFRMQSEVEIIDDGFKWRKYGKKSVKNSPNPRNYYKCSTDGCGVKKRVERDKDDERFVITTYEGVHTHVSPTLVYHTGQDAVSGRYFVAGYQISPVS